VEERGGGKGEGRGNLIRTERNFEKVIFSTAKREPMRRVKKPEVELRMVLLVTLV